MRIKFQHHVSMRHKSALWDGSGTTGQLVAYQRVPPPSIAQPFIVVFRHPIERLLSWYNFLRSGEEQRKYVERQQHFCAEGTGRAHPGVPCKPRLSELEFMMRNGSLYERRYIDGTEAAGLSVRATDAAFPGGSSGALGTDANFMFEWLRPRAAATLDEVKDFLLDKFALIGDTAQLATLQRMLARVYGLGAPDGKEMKEAPEHVKATHHDSVATLFTHEQYAKITARHSMDIELYYWALGQIEVLKRCFVEEAR